MSSKQFKSETLQDTHSIGAYLQALQKGLEQGHFTLTQAGETFEFSPKGLISFTVEGKAGGDERKVKLVIKWHEGDAGASDGDAPLLIET